MSTKDARKFAGMTQQEMSDALDIPKRTIENWDAGSAKCPEWARKLIVEKLVGIRFGKSERQNRTSRI